jgi:SAM-dependent methyltransferase
MKDIERWKSAQQRETAISRPKTSYTKDEEDQIRQRFGRSDTYWESYVEQRAGVRPADLSGRCVMEIGGSLFADQLLFQTKSRYKLILDPLAYPRISDDCEFVRGVAEHIPQRSSTLHFCWMTNTIDHCADPLSALQEIRRVLTEDGRLYITCNTFASWTRPLFPAFDYLDGPHPHHFTRSSFLDLLLKAGFAVEVEIPPWTPPLRGWNRAFGTIKVLLGRVFGLRQTQFRCCVAKTS